MIEVCHLYSNIECARIRLLHCEKCVSLILRVPLGRLCTKQAGQQGSLANK